METWLFAAALVAGVLLRTFFVLHHPPLGGDALLYGDLAHNILSHHIYGFTEDERIRSTLIRLPGYPGFLAVCFILFGQLNFTAVLWVQVLMDVATCALLGSLASRLAGKRAALITVWLAALCPFTALYSAVALSECGCLFGVGLTLFAMDRWMTAYREEGEGMGWAALTGAALIWGILLRPDQALLAMTVVPTMLWIGLSNWRAGLMKRLAPAILASFIIAAPLGLWAMRNWHTFHVFQPLAPRYANDPGEANPYGFQRWYRTWAIDFKATADLYWTYDGSNINLKDLPPRAFDNDAQRAETAKLYAEYAAAGASTPQLDAEFARLAAERVAGHPVRYYALLPTARMLDMWLRPRTEWTKIPLDWWNFSAHWSGSFKALGYAALNALYLLLAVAGLWKWSRAGWNETAPLAVAMLLFVLLRCVLLMTLDNAEQRYTLECFPVVFLLAGMAWMKRDREIS